MSEDKLKLEAFKRIEDGAKMTELVIELGVEYTKLLRWKRELKLAKENGTLSQLLDVGPLALENAADQIKHGLVDLGAHDEDLAAIEGELEEAIAGVDGLQKLNDKVQATAMTLTKRISGMAHAGNLEPKEVSLLVDSLTKIQTAFFSKPGIAILTPNGEPSPLGNFQTFLGN